MCFNIFHDNNACLLPFLKIYIINGYYYSKIFFIIENDSINHIKFNNFINNIGNNYVLFMDNAEKIFNTLKKELYLHKINNLNFIKIFIKKTYNPHLLKNTNKYILNIFI